MLCVSMRGGTVDVDAGGECQMKEVYVEKGDKKAY